MATLSVNVNKIALVRNSRGANFPDILKFSQDLINCGAEGITIHPRPDGRHIKFEDAYQLKEKLTVELNIEGYPTESFLEMVCRVKPAQCTLVPDPPHALTSNAGWDCKENMSFLCEVTSRLKENGVRTSIFLNPDLVQVPYAADCGADRIELYTEAYAASFGTTDQYAVAQHYVDTAHLASQAGLGINAGHDLNQQNLSFLLKQIPNILEVSIGHALVVEMWYQGMSTTIHNYHHILKG